MLADQLITIAYAIGGGITYSLIAFGKSTGEKFDWLKFLTTVVIGVAVGIAVVVTKMDYGTASDYVVGLGIVPLIENLGKAIWRRIVKPITATKSKKK